MTPVVGSVVVYVDEHAVQHNGLICAVWGEGETPSINLVYVSADPEKKDQYGRQIERNATSVVHATNQGAHGRYWTHYPA